MLRVSLAALLVLLSCQELPTADNAQFRKPRTGTTPLIDMNIGATYLGQTGGLYGDGSNTPPASHDSAGRAAATLVVPRRLDGTPAPTGRYILLTLGYSNAAQEGCAIVTRTSFPACNSWSFIGKAKVDSQVRKAPLGLFPGAMGGQTNLTWDEPTDSNYDIVKTRLQSKNGSEAQVQVVWFKIANKAPTVALPASNADMYQLIASTGDAIRAMKVRYPNLAQVYLASRIYAGYAGSALNPEPYAYESAFAVQHVVQAQITQRETGVIDSLAGDLGPTVAPWVGWGPYLWANGTAPRSDGLTWVRADFETDGTHPSTAGETKVANRLVQFFKTSPYSACWFRTGPSC